MTGQLMILVAGPYRSGTNDDPVLIQRNVDSMEDMALQVFRRGHLPVLGEWFALPLLKHAGSSSSAFAARAWASSRRFSEQAWRYLASRAARGSWFGVEGLAPRIFET